MKYKIIVDSASDLKSDYLIDEEIGFSVAPLTIHVGNEMFVDNDALDPNEMLRTIEKFKGKPTSSCPNPHDYASLFGDAENVFIVTITAKLSGAYNSAVLASKDFEGKNILVIDSKATSGVLVRIVDQLVTLIKSGLEYEDIKTQIIEFRDRTHLFFVLDRFDNLINNGRISKPIALLCNLLKIKILCIAEDGEIKLSSKVRTRASVINTLVSRVCEKQKEIQSEEVIISHCEDEETANYVCEELTKSGLFKKIRVISMRGLCSFYALSKGIIVSF